MKKQSISSNVGADISQYFHSKAPTLVKKKYLGLPLNQFILVCVFILPAFIHLAIFWLGSQITAIGQGFTDQETGLFTLENYAFIFEQLKAEDSTLALAFGNTMKYFLKNLIMMPVSIFVAYMFYKKMFGHMFVRVVLFIPPIICR